LSETFDIIIKNGTIYDGTGQGSFVSDIFIKNELVVDIRKSNVNDKCLEEIDANGLIITPGFVDIHTHYDGQVTWDNYISPSSWHGVTTAIMGNCGVGFAPVHHFDHDRLVTLMEGVEDIPEVVLTEGLEWKWETFGDYLDYISKRSFDIDIGAQVPHGALRLYVMGQRGADREIANDEDIKLMSKLAAEAVSIGALGFTTSRTINHRTSEGDLVPQFTAAENELVGISKAIGKTNKGVMQLVTDLIGGRQEYLILEKMVIESNRPLSITVAQTDANNYEWEDLLGWIEDSANNGLPIKAQVCGRPVGLVLGLSVTLNPFSAHPSFNKISNLPLEEKTKIMQSPNFKKKLLNEKPTTNDGLILSILRNYNNIYILDDPPNYEPLIEESLGFQAKKVDIEVDEFLYDCLLMEDGKKLLYYPIGNYMDSSLDAAKRMMESEHSLLGLGDGGAHCATICDASFTTHMLTFWGRDRVRGPKMDLSWIIKSHTRDNALAMGLNDRGLISKGMKADINVIDFDNLTLHAPEVVNDLPAGGKRLIQNVDGYVATIMSGKVTYRNGMKTGELPGKLIRS
jgi:N-acyl-D-aspartate/D-glutamate deacylase|tara:strand:- start:34 stop:1746 length:1713 start_codon:yes stop_codon:yes gene_type:complete